MKVITLAAQKGGAGKSTLAAHLAVAAAQDGLRVVVLDSDPQGSLQRWGQIREAGDIAIRAVAPLEVKRTVGTLDADLVLIDTAPHSTASGAAAIELADLVVIPTRPAALDLAAVPPTLALVNAARRPALAVLTQAPPVGREIAESIEALQGAGLAVSQAVQHIRADHHRSLGSGLGVTEFASSSKAAAEVQALWADVRARLGLKPKALA